MNEEAAVPQVEHFPLSNEVAFASRRCPICGTSVETTEARVEYASLGHPELCGPCLWHRNETRSKAKVRARAAAAARRIPGLLEQSTDRFGQLSTWPARERFTSTSGLREKFSGRV